MQLSKITLLKLSLNYLIDKNEKYPVEAVHRQIADRTIFEILNAKYSAKYQDIRLDGLKRLTGLTQDQTDLIDALDRLANGVIADELRVDDKMNGLLFLSALLNELIQSNIKEIRFA